MKIHKMVCKITAAYAQRNIVSPADMIFFVEGLYAAIIKFDKEAGTTIQGRPIEVVAPEQNGIAKMVGDSLISGENLGAIGERIKDAAVKAQSKKAVTGHGISVPGFVKPIRKQKPAVPINQSITDEYIICLEDGKHCKMMKRHLTKLGLTPDDYRLKWGLPHDYPMSSPAFRRARKEVALKTGLGKRHGVNRNQDSSTGPVSR